MTVLLILEDLCKLGDRDESHKGSTTATGGTTTEITSLFEESELVATLEDLIGHDRIDLVI